MKTPDNVFKKEHRIGYFQKDNPGKTIYVGNLSYQMDEKHVFKLFNQFGTVKYVKLIVDTKTNKPKGIAFVQMPKSSEAEVAISTLDGQVVEGRTLKVSEAKEQDKPKKKPLRKKPLKAK